MEHRDRLGRAEEYVFGLMDAKARERAERDMETDTEFRNCVMEVAERLRKLHVSRETVPMPEKSWREIGTRIAAMPQMAASLPRPGSGAGRPGATQPFAHQLGGMRGAVVAACLLVAMGIGYLAGMSVSGTPPLAAIAVLEDEIGTPMALAEFRENGNLRVLPLAGFVPPEGQMLRLWARPGDGGPAIALGTLARHGETRFDAAGLPAPQDGVRLEISLEDQPGEQPSGPPVASGTAIATIKAN